MCHYPSVHLLSIQEFGPRDVNMQTVPAIGSFAKFGTVVTVVYCRGIARWRVIRDICAIQRTISVPNGTKLRTATRIVKVIFRSDKAKTRREENTTVI